MNPISALRPQPEDDDVLDKRDRNLVEAIKASYEGQLLPVAAQVRALRASFSLLLIAAVVIGALGGGGLAIMAVLIGAGR